MALVKIITLVILFFASILMIYWLFRPGAKERYDAYGRIPIKNSAKKQNLKDVSDTFDKIDS
ncbi:MAG: cbb3-type cytochrome c oxidase subunit 3 [Candidatus Jidaibacter sp.]|jgi:cbb3-type cytochrome oxidase subunit 3|nr:cbb3-type cytochrome c oxidase subunit 3 [Candidatus Jidaibacter sp.]